MMEATDGETLRKELEDRSRAGAGTESGRSPGFPKSSGHDRFVESPFMRHQAGT